MIRNNRNLEHENRALILMLSELIKALGSQRQDRLSMDAQVAYSKARRFLLTRRVKEPAPEHPNDT